jgi:hypothetical protein
LLPFIIIHGEFGENGIQIPFQDYLSFLFHLQVFVHRPYQFSRAVKENEKLTGWRRDGKKERHKVLGIRSKAKGMRLTQLALDKSPLSVKL